MAERDYWSENLQPARFAGVEFPVGPRTIAGGRSWAKHRFAFRDGQDDEDTGREPLVFEVEIPLFRSIDVEHYPNTFEALRFAFDDPETKGRGEWQDPELGILTVKVDRWQWITDPNARNGGIFKLRVEEVGDEAFVYTTAASGEPIEDPADAADLADAEIAELGVTKADVLAALEADGVAMEDPDAVAEGAAMLAIAGDVLTTIGENVDAIEIEAGLDTALARIDAVCSLEAVIGVDGAEAFGLLVELAGALTSAAERAVRRAAVVKEIELEGGASSAEIAVRFYGDARRAAEIERRNPTFCALFYESGAVLSLAAS